MMKDELRRHLDGELPTHALGPVSRAEAQAWDRMVASFRQAAPRQESPPWLEQRVMAEIEALPEPGRSRRLLAWLLNPAPLRVSPLAAALVAAGLVAVALLPGRSGRVAPTAPVAQGAPGDAVIYVQFVLQAPAATSVAVAGDFSDWQPSFLLTDSDGDGLWTGRVPVRPGVHGYMFLIDDTDWQTDPNAERYRDDGFGNRNAVLAVAASG
jgi:hypothetical protein